MVEAGTSAFDPAGERVGVVEHVYPDRATGQPAFALVGNGAAPGSGSQRAIVPLAGAVSIDSGLALGFSFDAITSAPDAQLDDELTPEREAAVLAHFGVTPPAPAPADAPTEVFEQAAMTRSEEQLVVDKVEVPRERVRLVKHVVTEDVTVTVTLRREELRVEREPIANPDPLDLPPGTEIAPSEMEFFLLAEEPVVSTRVVPVERVRVGKDGVVEPRQVGGEVRKEQIEIERTPPTAG